MGRHYASAGRVVPVKSKTNVAPSEQVFYEITIRIASEFVDKGLPGCRQVKPFLVLEHLTVMALLPILALLADERLETGKIRHGRHKRLESRSG